MTGLVRWVHPDKRVSLHLSEEERIRFAQTHSLDSGSGHIEERKGDRFHLSWLQGKKDSSESWEGGVFLSSEPGETGSRNGYLSRKTASA